MSAGYIITIVLESGETVKIKDQSEVNAIKAMNKICEGRKFTERNIMTPSGRVGKI